MTTINRVETLFHELSRNDFRTGARSGERGDELFAVIKETRPTNAIRSHPFETAVCLASHCHDDGELVGIFMDGDRRVSTRLNKGITVTQM